MNIFRKIKQNFCTHSYTKIKESEFANPRFHVTMYRCELCGYEITCLEPARRERDMYGTR